MFQPLLLSASARRGLLAICASAFLILPATAAEDSAFFFRDGDRAMILGDSITQGRTYSTYIESYVLSRFPKWNITFRNTGWSGDTMGLRLRGGLEKGFMRDLQPLKPTAVTIDFGMNDGRARDKGYPEYLANAQKMAKLFAAEGTRVAFVTSSPEERFQANQPAGSEYNLVLRKYSDGLKTVAAENQLPFVDQLAPMIEVIETGRKEGILGVDESGARLAPDGVHPNPSGGVVMAAVILKGLKAPSLVSSVEVNAANGEAKADGATVSNVKTGETLSFTRLDEAMPWPLPKDGLVAAKISNFKPFDDLSRYELKVTNLSAPKYEVAIDGKPIGTFTKEELAGGVNVSEKAADVMPEVGKLLEAIRAKNDVYYKLWRDVKLAQLPDWVPQDVIEPAREARMKELEGSLSRMEEKLQSQRQPVSHEWTLKPAA